MPGEFRPLSREPLTITVAGTRFTLPYRPAAEWANCLGSLYALAGRLAEGGDREQMADLLIGHPQAVDDLKRESLRILAEEGGRPWWEVARLINTSTDPEILGRMVLAGADAWQRSVGEWCSAVYALCMKGQDEKGRLRFDFSLSIPPPEFEDEWDDGDDPVAVQAQLNQLLGKK